MPLQLDKEAILAAQIYRQVGAPDHVFEFSDKAKQSGLMERLIRTLVRQDIREDVDTIQVIRELSTNFFKLARWAKYGFNVFNLTHSLAAGLLLTEPSEFKPEEFHLPFPCFAVRIPEGTIPLFEGNVQTWAIELWVHVHESYKLSEDRDPVVIPTELVPWIYYSVTSSTGLTLWRDIPISELERPFPGGEHSQILNEDPPVVPEDDITVATTVRIIRNLASWLNSTGGIESHQPEYQPPNRYNSPTEERPWPKTWVLGREVKLSKELRRIAPEIALGKKRSSQGWEVRVRFVVRGHMRSQPYGPQRSLRREQWIEPYWKGPAEAEAWAHLYESK